MNNATFKRLSKDLSIGISFCSAKDWIRSFITTELYILSPGFGLLHEESIPHLFCSEFCWFNSTDELAAKLCIFLNWLLQQKKELNYLFGTTCGYLWLQHFWVLRFERERREGFAFYKHYLWLWHKSLQSQHSDNTWVKPILSIWLIIDQIWKLWAKNSD